MVSLVDEAKMGSRIPPKGTWRDWMVASMESASDWQPQQARTSEARAARLTNRAIPMCYRDAPRGCNVASRSDRPGLRGRRPESAATFRDPGTARNLGVAYRWDRRCWWAPARRPRQSGRDRR